MKKFVEKGKKMITLSIFAMAVMCGTALAANIDAIVPASLPITVSADGSVVTATKASIQNYGSEPLWVSSINVAAQNGWSLATKDTAATAAIGDKVIAMAFNGQWSDTNGAVNVASFDKIAAKGSLPLKYDAKAPAAKTAESEEAATATFVVKDLQAPTMAAADSWYKSSEDRDQITKITFRDIYTPTSTVDETWFADENNTGAITCYRTGTEIIIAGNGSGKIMANPNSSYMFTDYYDDENIFYVLAAIDNLALLDTSNVTNMESMFAYCERISSIDFSNFNTSKVSNMKNMFRYLGDLTSLNLSSFNTSSVTTMESMFYDCSSLTNLNLSSFNTSKVRDMSYMFYGCARLTSLNLSSFNTSKVTDISDMFARCSSLMTLDLSSFNTSNVTLMDSLFEECSSLIILDLSSFNTSNVTYMMLMFNSCSNLTTIYASDKWNTDKVSRSNYMFTGCTKLKGDIAFNSNYVDKTYAKIHNGYLTTKNVAVPMLAYEFSWFTNGFESIDDADSYMTSIKKIIFKDSYTPSGNESKSWNADSKNSGAIKCYLSDNTLIVAGNGSGSIKANPDSNYMFNENYGEIDFDSLTGIDGLELLDTLDVEYMQGMFYGCKKLTTLDLSNFDTSSVTDMNYMFECCSNLTTIYVSDKWNTNKVSKNSRMFLYCSSLKGAISYDSTKTDATYANWTTGYFTYKAVSTKTLSLNIDPTSGTVTSYDVSPSPMSTYKEMIRAVAAA